MDWTIAALCILGCGVASVLAWRFTRRVWWLVPAVAALCLGMLPLVGQRNATRSDRPATQLTATDPAAIVSDGTATERAAMKPTATERPRAPSRYVGKRQEEFARRWDVVCAEVGPPPEPNAVPVVGYTSAGVAYPSRWRSPPDTTTANNIKARRGKP